MEDFRFEGLELLLDDEYGETSSCQSQILQEQLLPESNESIILNDTTSEMVGEKTVGQLGNFKEDGLAFALALVALDTFCYLDWANWVKSYGECPKVFYQFKAEVFDAIAYYAWNLYEKEDFESIQFIDDIYFECKMIWETVSSTKEHFELDSSLIDIHKNGKVRERDLCNILRLSETFYRHLKEYSDYGDNAPPNLKISWNNLYHYQPTEFPYFGDNVPPHLILGVTSFKDLRKYVLRAKNVISSFENLDPKGMAKERLRIDLTVGICRCVEDALFIQSWQSINLRDLEGSSSPQIFKRMVAQVYRMIHCMPRIRKDWLIKCHRSLLYPIRSKIDEPWGRDVFEVIILADLKRRSEDRRFIGTDHVLFYINQMLGNNLEQLKSISCSSKTEEKHKDTIHHLYPKARIIAKYLGAEVIGLEHLYAAITLDNDEISWKEPVEEFARMMKTEGKKNMYQLAHEQHGPSDNDSNALVTRFKKQFSVANAVVWQKCVQDGTNQCLKHAIARALGKEGDKCSDMT